MIELQPVEGSPFPRYEWRSKKTGADCSPRNPHRRSLRFHTPTRVIARQEADVARRETMVA